MFHPDLQTSLPTVLRSATEKAHQQLEDALGSSWQSLDEPGRYARLLAAFYGFFAPVEQRIETIFPRAALPDFTERRKADWILDDLATIGSHTAPDVSNYLPEIASESAAWGALYVLEGSTLGGRHISGIIRKALPDAPLRFFTGYGPDTGARWVAFRNALEAWGEEHDPKPVIETANATFENFYYWIRQTL